MSKSCARSNPRLPGHARWQSSNAFTLLPIGLAILGLGVLTAVVVPQVKKSLIATRSEAVADDLRTFTRAFQAYLREKGDWPPEQSTAGQLPAGLAGYLQSSHWGKITPIGGRYNWEKNQKHNGRTVRAAIAISTKGPARVTSDRLQLEDLDRQIDDGNLATGSFLLGYANAPLYIIEP